MADIARLERKKGTTFRIRVGAGYDFSGKQIRHSMNWTPPSGMTERQIEKELNKVVVDFENRVQDGLVYKNIKFSDFAEKWLLDYADKQCSPKYRFESRRMLVDINKSIGHIPLQKLKKLHLQEFYTKLSEEPRLVSSKSRNSEGQLIVETIERFKSPSTILHYHRLISTILTKATQWDFIDQNICLGKGIELPKQKKHKPSYLQDDEIAKLVHCIESAPIEYRTFIMLLLYTGIRNGEAMGLEWGDIDYANRLISINRASQYVSRMGVFTKETKNSSSERVFKVVPEVIDLLREYKKWQNESKLGRGPLWKANPNNTEEKHCDNWNNCKQKKDFRSVYCPLFLECKDHIDIDRLFTQYNGIPMHPDTPLRWLKKFIKRHDLPDFNIHSLRHTNVSLMIMQGIPLPTVAKLAGHSSTATTSKIYSHSIQTAEQLAMEKVANVINPNRASH